MNKPDNIPQDVWDAAENMPLVDTDDMDFGISLVIARAILAERERCAEIADTTVSSIGVGGGEFYIAAKIAAAIRKGGE